MATSSITENFVVEGKEQVEMFANAVEESYQESLTRNEKSDVKITYVRGTRAMENFMNKWRKAHEDGK